MATPASPIVINFEGAEHHFPSDFSQQDIAKALATYKTKPSIQPPSGNNQEREPYQSPVDTSKIPVRQLQPSDLPGPGRQLQSNLSVPDVGAALANSMPAVGAAIGAPEGGLGAIPGAAAGSFIKRGLQAISPKYFGSIPQDQGVGGDLLDTGLDTVGAGILPGVIGKVGSKAASLIANPSEATASTLASKFFRNTEPVQKAVGQDVTQGVNALTGDSFSDLTSPRLSATRDLFKKGFSPTSGRIDADKILDEMKLNPDTYKAIPTEFKSNITEFLNTAKSMQGDASSTGHLLSMVKSKPILAIPGMMAGSALGGLAGHGFVGATVGAGAGIMLGESAISKLMSNPEIARLTIQAMKTPATAQESSIISKVILNALRGTEVMVTTPDGKPEKALVNDKGQVTYPPRQ